MKALNLTLVLALFVGIVIVNSPGLAQNAYPTEPVNFAQRSLAGPRFGMTYVMGTGELYDDLKSEGMGRTMSQFGWHFEHQVIPEGGGPQFVVEFVPLLAGVEYGKLVPGTTLAMGVRLPGGLEFGLGPNLLVTKSTEEGTTLNTSLVTAIGKSINYGGVSIPLNLAFASNPDGNRVSLICGYAIAKISAR